MHLFAAATTSAVAGARAEWRVSVCPVQRGETYPELHPQLAELQLQLEQAILMVMEKVGW